MTKNFLTDDDNPLEWNEELLQRLSEDYDPYQYVYEGVDKECTNCSLEEWEWTEE